MSSVDIAQVYNKIKELEELEIEVNWVLGRYDVKTLDDIVEKMDKIKKENEKLREKVERVENENWERMEKIEVENKKLREQVERVEKENGELRKQVMKWEYEYGEYQETPEDMKFYEKMENFPETTGSEIVKKIIQVTNRIAEKLGDIVEDFEENDGMFFIKFFEHGDLWCDSGKAQIDLSYREEKMIEKELDLYCDLEYKWRKMGWGQ